MNAFDFFSNSSIFHFLMEGCFSLDAVRSFIEKSFLLMEWKDLFLFSPLLILYIASAAFFVGRLRTGQRLITPYTRKIFHFLVFTMAAVLQVVCGLKAVVIFSFWAIAAVLVAVWRGNGNPFYEALARSKDEPHRSLFILVPLASTAVGGLLSSLFFPETAFIGYLVAGWADAIAEPVGTLWGRHAYSVPSLFGVRATRSLEGSSSVLLIGIIAVLICGAVLDTGLSKNLLLALVCGPVAALVEAFSPHGLDNWTVQLAVAAAAAMVLSG
jgi:phytol kinase